MWSGSTKQHEIEIPKYDYLMIVLSYMIKYTLLLSISGNHQPHFASGPFLLSNNGYNKLLLTLEVGETLDNRLDASQEDCVLVDVGASAQTEDLVLGTDGGELK